MNTNDNLKFKIQNAKILNSKFEIGKGGGCVVLVVES